MVTHLLILPLDTLILLGTQTFHEITQLKLQRWIKIFSFLVHKFNGRGQIYFKKEFHFK